MSDAVLLNVENNIATLAFNRPIAWNSFNFELAEKLESLTDKVRHDQTIRAVCLRGEGETFMVGGDLKFFKEKMNQMPEGVMKIVRTLNASILNLMKMPKPVLACVQGSVAGVGMSLMLACDLVIAAEQTKFTMAYSGIGISPDGGASFNLPRMIGTKKAMALMLLSEVFNEKNALELGLVNWIVTKEQLHSEAQKLLTRLAQGPTQSYASIKKLLYQSTSNQLEQQLENEGLEFERCSITADFNEGVESFLNKKKPKFSGK